MWIIWYCTRQEYMNKQSCENNSCVHKCFHRQVDKGCKNKIIYVINNFYIAKWLKIKSGKLPEFKFWLQHL